METYISEWVAGIGDISSSGMGGKVKVPNLVERFLEDEISSQELYDAIHDFVTSFHIRSGEFEGNYYVIKKMDKDNFFVFPENIYPDKHREIPNCFSIYQDNLVKSINAHAKKLSFAIKRE